ncbi:hypothetical protein [Caloramator australicus]|uniref:Uncharacterized protein n=1 Tax=Caloramator australicus RC3 TaxID=857293 RepID=I7LIE1_9CLOT|nr:hypothetical protein [Caloramator australicus]CCJ32862.1 hypothetical protein CAAU_0778 [Caloramator australicus RC3]
MDAQTLAVLSSKVSRANYIQNRLKVLINFKRNLENAQNASLLIKLIPGGGTCLDLHTMSDSSQVFRDYKEFLLKGIDNEISKLENEFKEL